MREHACIHVHACILRRLLDSQGLDGGGLLMYEEAQPLETGLMNTGFESESESVSETGSRVRVGVRVRVMDRVGWGVSLVAARPLLLHQRLLLR